MYVNLAPGRRQAGGRGGGANYARHITTGPPHFWTMRRLWVAINDILIQEFHNFMPH
jgi:hypothetical protein